MPDDYPHHSPAAAVLACFAKLRRTGKSGKKRAVRPALMAIAALMSSCTQQESGADATGAGDKSLNIYNWSDYIGPDTISSFEEKTGIKVRVSYFDSNEALRTRMLAGSSGFDVVFPSATFFQPEVASGAYRKLDMALLPDIANLDPVIVEQVRLNDPGSSHAAVYLWGTIGIGYNKDLVAKALPSAPLSSWRLIFVPENAAKLAGCGINFIDEPTGIVELVLLYLGKDPHSPTLQDLAEVEKVLTAIRPYIRNIDTSGEIEAMANGDICVALAYNGNMVQARNRAIATKGNAKVGYLIPAEGAPLWFTLLAVPHDAPHVNNAHLFINYMLNPRVIAKVTNSVGYANAVPASIPFLEASIAGDPAIYPTLDERKRLFVVTENTPDLTRAITRLWQKFKSGQ